MDYAKTTDILIAAIVVILTGNSLLASSNDGTSTNMAAYRLPDDISKSARLKTEDSLISVHGNNYEFKAIEFISGRQVSGLKLEPYPVVTAFWFAWKAFSPATEIFEQ